MSSKTTGDYEVGNRKPPKHTQFKKGRSGNPQGRRRAGPKPINAGLLLDPELTVTKDGGPQRMSAYEIYLRRLVSQALEDKKVTAIKTLLELFEKHGVLVPPPPPPDPSRVARIPWRMGVELDKKYPVGPDGHPTPEFWQAVELYMKRHAHR
jgi:hypothetical protein